MEEAEKKIFNPKFVHFMWDDELEGKMGFVADNINDLQDFVDGTHYKPAVVSRSDKSDCFPFKIKDDNGNGMNFKFFYYDPLYEFKLAQKQGKTVQCMTTINVKNGWADMSDSWNWNINPDTKYRIKPEKDLRPFKDIQELKNAWSDKAGLSADYEEPMIWVRRKGGNENRLINAYNYGGGAELRICADWVSLKQLFEQYEFIDGTSCGVEFDL